MTFSKKLCGALGATGLSLFAALPAWAPDAAPPAATAPERRVAPFCIQSI